MANRKFTAPFGVSILKLLDSLGRDLFGLYRPERHYMRGPGPKWREKHAPESHPAAIPLHHSKAAV